VRSFELKYEVPGTAPGERVTRYKSIKGSKRDAQAELVRLLGEVDRGSHIDPHKVTLAEFLTRWLDDWATLHVSAKTCERYRQLVAHQVAPYLGSTPVQRVKPVDLQKLYADLLRAGGVGGGALSPLTVGHVHRLLRRALGHAATWGIIQQNPAAAVHPPRVPENELQIPSDAEIRAVLDYLRDRDRPLHTLAVVALATGCRRGELCALQWRDIDLAKGTIRIERSFEQTTGRLAFRAPKTKKSRRTVTIPASTVAELRAHRLAQQEERLAAGVGRIEPDALVFANPDGSARKPNRVTNNWLVATRAVGRGINLHSLRHVHVSHLIAAGLDVLAISRRVGHASPVITLSRYAHLIPNNDDRAAQVVEEMFRRMSGGNPVAKAT
jgi:integrase